MIKLCECVIGNPLRLWKCHSLQALCCNLIDLKVVFWFPDPPFAFWFELKQFGFSLHSLVWGRQSLHNRNDWKPLKNTLYVPMLLNKEKKWRHKWKHGMSSMKKHLVKMHVVWLLFENYSVLPSPFPLTDEAIIHIFYHGSNKSGCSCSSSWRLNCSILSLASETYSLMNSSMSVETGM